MFVVCEPECFTISMVCLYDTGSECFTIFLVQVCTMVNQNVLRYLWYVLYDDASECVTVSRAYLYDEKSESFTRSLVHVLCGGEL